MADEQDLIRKIQGLIAKAEGTDNENEANAFFAKATELMTKYAIDSQRVRESMDSAARLASRPKMVEFMYATNDSNAVGKAHLLNLVAQASGVKMVNYSNRRYDNMTRPGNQGIASQWCALIGFEQDVEVVKVLYASLLIQAARFGHTAWKAQTRSSVGKSRYFTGFLSGFATRVYQRMLEAKNQIDPSLSALVVSREAEVEDATKEHFPRLVSRNHKVDMFGRMAGMAAGNQADLGQSRMTSGHKAIGSGR